MGKQETLSCDARTIDYRSISIYTHTMINEHKMAKVRYYLCLSVHKYPYLSSIQIALFCIH